MRNWTLRKFETSEFWHISTPVRLCKYTTTERMLYYSGLIKHMGEVHHGNTVTDYMDQERQRGITITSAAVTFQWKNHRINLIDTPGHIDFTMEVEQTLRVLDGAVVILDGSAGVEAQTLTVCRQADKYNIPRIIYVNKMDRADANFDMCLRSIESKLNVEILPTQFPIKEKGILEGIVDIVSLEKLVFDKKDMGMKYIRLKLSENEDSALWEMANEKRRSLADKLSSMDDKLAEAIIEQESLDAVTPQMLLDSIYRSTISRKGVPVLLGSSYKNIGVQPLMDSILLYLPSPDESIYSIYHRCFEQNLSARAFKVVHDKQKGPITFFRIYSGSIKKGANLYNMSRDKKEIVTKLYIAYADEYQEVSKMTHGNIAALTGLKSTMTGDVITSGPTAAKQAKQKLAAHSHSTLEDAETIFACDFKSVEPVFFCSIEAPSLSMQAPLDIALQQLQREDPSLRVSQNEETGQIVLAGMGELHLEIIKERIRTEYKIDVDLGPLQISYREAIKEPIQDTYSCEHRIGNIIHTVTVTMSLIPNYRGKEILLLDKSPEYSSNITAIPIKMMKAVKTGVQSVLSHGPKLSYPVLNMGVKLHYLEYGSNTSSSVVTAAVSQCIRKLMNDVGVNLLEPIMRLEIVVPEKYSSPILKDLSKRRGQIQHIDVRGQNRVIECFAPLAELLGYSTTVRILSSGHASLSLEFDHYELMDSASEAEAIKKVTGFY
ncbi:mitochondrial ribosome recycling factor 2 isoform X2 [Xylocopa sonorina]|uniref:mitochondrial ribosome recycling factor 2 isoform X2 n=1 Tax=Xylocopa sonorina TaxID=1818115 RepID=UPI00403AB5C7